MHQHRLSIRIISLGVLLLGLQLPLEAHVKWFSRYSFYDQPFQFTDVLRQPVIGLLLVVTTLVVGSLTHLHRRVAGVAERWLLPGWLRQYQGKELSLLRIVVAAVLLLSWQTDVLLMPELRMTSTWVGWIQLVMALMLVIASWTPWVGVGLWGLYLYGVSQYGLFHMLDYMLVPGIGGVFWCSQKNTARWQTLGLWCLYLSLGGALVWAGMEKLVYPQWGVSLLEMYPRLALGMDKVLFMQGAAFIEIGVGVLLMFGTLPRLLAVVLTLLLMLTSTVFGKLEVAGHLLIHGALLVFLLQGSGSLFQELPAFYRRLVRQPVLASLGFVLLFFLLLGTYTWGANQKYSQSQTSGVQEGATPLEVKDLAFVPELMLQVGATTDNGWLLELKASNFAFCLPDEEVGTDTMGGYAALYLDGQLLSRLYRPWYYLPPLPPGDHSLEVRLYTTSQQQLTYLGLPIQARHPLKIAL